MARFIALVFDVRKSPGTRSTCLEISEKRYAGLIAKEQARAFPKPAGLC